MYSLQFFINFQRCMPPYPPSALAFAPSASSCPQKRSTFFTLAKKVNIFSPLALQCFFFGVISLQWYIIITKIRKVEIRDILIIILILSWVSVWMNMSYVFWSLIYDQRSDFKKCRENIIFITLTSSFRTGVLLNTQSYSKMYSGLSVEYKPAWVVSFYNWLCNVYDYIGHTIVLSIKIIIVLV